MNGREKVGRGRSAILSHLEKVVSPRAAIMSFCKPQPGPGHPLAAVAVPGWSLQPWWFWGVLCRSLLGTHRCMGSAGDGLAVVV